VRKEIIMDNETFVFIDDGFLNKLSKYFGDGNYIKFDRIKLAENLAKKQNLICKNVYYYTAPPFQSERPTSEESIRYKNYEKFAKRLSENKKLILREGRCQRLKLKTEEFIYKQKAVDSLMIIDMMSVPIKNPEIKKLIIVASDSDFVPVMEELKELNIEVILYTYFVKKRDTGLSRSNYLIKSVSRYVKLTKQDFENAVFIK
jgi:uncharacterized LabA/DUF88 family protein